MQVAPGLFLLPLPLEAPGFSSFIGAWLCRTDRLCFLVDPGPSATVPALADMLDALEVDRLSFVLLTHIHLDHAGGAGDLLARRGSCPVICHSSAIAHLHNPARLWEGSLKTLGDLARSYGAPRPVDKDLLADAASFSEAGVKPILTPGHAPHHVSYLFRDVLFAGETGGVHADLAGGRSYLRPATPPRFFFETSLESLDALIHTPHRLYCFGHFGSTERSAELLPAHREQLHQWKDLIGEVMEQGRPDPLAASLSLLLERDPNLAGLSGFSPEVREREIYFLKNSIRGFMGYLSPRDAR
ncbi:MAG: MBL fold metallo-hydrolase [Thermodesulfobacteriota bacterium]